MTKDDIKAFLEEKPGYLKVSADRLSERLNCTAKPTVDISIKKW